MSTENKPVEILLVCGTSVLFTIARFNEMRIISVRLINDTCNGEKLRDESILCHRNC